MCKYTIEKDAAPYPRVKYNAECGYQLAIMEGYEFDSTKSCGGTPFSTRSERLNLPTGNCRKCATEIEHI